MRPQQQPWSAAPKAYSRSHPQSLQLFAPWFTAPKAYSSSHRVNRSSEQQAAQHPGGILTWCTPENAGRRLSKVCPSRGNTVGVTVL